MSLRREVSMLVFLAIFTLFLLSACGSTPGTGQASSGLKVVAAENFYGNIVKQLGGDHVSVTSILSDPGVDPHEYEANFNNSKAVGFANLVIANGGGYDAWMDKLLTSSPNKDRVVLKGFELAPTKLPDNEHVWYNVDNVQTIAEKITLSLKKLDAPHAVDFASNLETFKKALDPLRQKLAEIKTKYSGVAVGLTETIYLYQAQPMGLHVLTPFEFQKALAEGNDPPANTVITAEKQIAEKQIRVLIYNEQTVSKVTSKLLDEAKAKNIPIVPVTETMPSNKTYQSWQLDQLNNLEASLGKSEA